MDVPEGVDERSGFEPADLGDHERQQRIRGDIEGYAQEYVRTPLIQLTAESLPAIRIACHIELKQRMTRHKRHIRQIGHVPGADDEATAVGILFYLLDDLGDLVDDPAVGAFPATPLFAIYGSELTISIRPFVPDAYTMLMQIPDIRLTPQEP